MPKFNDHDSAVPYCWVINQALLLLLLHNNVFCLWMELSLRFVRYEPARITGTSRIFIQQYYYSYVLYMIYTPLRNAVGRMWCQPSVRHNKQTWLYSIIRCCYSTTAVVSSRYICVRVWYIPSREAVDDTIHVTHLLSSTWNI